MRATGRLNHLFKPAQRKPDPPKSPHGSWWITAKRDQFTKTAETLVQPPMPVLLKPLYDDEC